MVNNESSVDIGQIDISTTEPQHRCPICQKPADKRCSACQSVSYCSADHQKRDWKAHKSSCRCYTVKRNESYGRFLVATRDIPQGTIVLSDEPIVVGPKRCTLPVCLGCHKPLQDGCHRCSKCTYPMCAEECEKAPIHAENECVIFQRATHPVGSRISNFDSFCPAYECITPLRCLLLRERNPSKWEKLTSMEHHNELRKSVPGLWNRNCVNVVKLLHEWYKMKDEFDEDTIHSVIGYVDVNSFEIKFRDVTFCGLYRESALMCHDCVPNTHNAITITNEHKMIVRASIPIKKGEMITTSYARQLGGTIERRSFLKETKYFDCFCQRCQDRTEFSTFMSAVKCTECSTGYMLPKDPLGVKSTDWLCRNVYDNDRNDAVASKSTSNGAGNSHCAKTLKSEQIKNILRKASNEIEEVTQSTSGSQISRLERVLKKYSGKVLHPNHHILLGVIKDLNYLYAGSLLPKDDDNENKEVLIMDRLMRAKSLCLQMLGVLDMIDPGLSRLRGVTLYQMSKCDYQISKMKFQANELSKEDFQSSINGILAYLKTCREIMELDNMIVPNSHVYCGIVDYIVALNDALDAIA